ncbi:hypothetical protein A2Y85_00725 [candidate division WOR-3 bacterium RBG_13_43_14]|uniref:Undecaprenyl-PP-MurNAc-pentapeptide-UDPGlcNAc GlcNAc transferase n=1 Tax=candidate division WOR-3 bacterium RBG_13_43_14 TaxID=1802590 RepID=A0A1F4UAH2_UNCW3|nr:MAG: hypothetical protein A2Y85_00725 [candidate division WOR-3 bacterium RBG_13_43_14]
MHKAIISGIGTGGHYFPALVVALEFIKQRVQVIFLVRKGSPEQEIAAKYGITTMAINPHGFFGKSLHAKIESLISMLISIVILGSVTKRSVGMAFGGYGAIPLVISCIINRCPFFLFEPNRVPGRATRLFSSRARAIFLGLGSNRKINGKAFITGIPVRREFRQGAPVNKQADCKTVLIYGGSQGSRFLNQIAIDIQKVLPGNFQLRIVSGKRDYERIRANVIGPTSVIPFTLNPWDEINTSDIIVSRAGALAGYEIAVSRKPVIFVPFPYAIDNHQYYNAQYFSTTTNAVLIEEKDMTAARLVEEIQKFGSDISRFDRGLILNAETRIYEIVKELS